jgi:hypothetical protein
LPHFIHPVIGIFRVYIVDPDKYLFELIIHSIKLMASGKTRSKFFAIFPACRKDFITQDHYCLSQVQGREFSGWDIN